MQRRIAKLGEFGTGVWLAAKNCWPAAHDRHGSSSHSIVLFCGCRSVDNFCIAANSRHSLNVSTDVHGRHSDGDWRAG
jgi:hypothetical protein